MDLNIEEVKKLDEVMREEWQNFVDAAPPSWKEDGFIVDHVPIAVTCRYGQNQPICKPGEERDEARAFRNERMYGRVRFVTVALATHLR